MRWSESSCGPSCVHLPDLFRLWGHGLQRLVRPLALLPRLRHEPAQRPQRREEYRAAWAKPSGRGGVLARRTENPPGCSPCGVSVRRRRLRDVAGSRWLDHGADRHAFLVPERTMAQRISRAKQRIKDSGIPFRTPHAEERAQRLRAVLHILYLIFNEGYTSSVGPDLLRPNLSHEAIRLARMVHRLQPDNTEVAGLLALILLTDARRLARIGANGGAISPRAARQDTLGQASNRGGSRAPLSHIGRKARSAPTSCRPPSPPSTMKQPRPATPIGRRFWRSTTSSGGRPITPWSR